jgi:hypothetical protein
MMPGGEGAALSIDYTGQHGGQLAMAFLWKVLGKAKDEQIASLTKTIEKNEERCAETVGALSDRVKQLETLLLLHGPGDLRQDLQRALAEIEFRLETSGVKP